MTSAGCLIYSQPDVVLTHRQLAQDAERPTPRPITLPILYNPLLKSGMLESYRLGAAIKSGV